MTNSPDLQKSEPYVITIDGKKTISPVVGVYKMWSPDVASLPPILQDSFDSILNSSPYLSALFPVADNSIVLKERIPIQASSVVPFAYVSAIDDYFFVKDMTRIDNDRSEQFLDRGVGVVSGSYFGDKLGKPSWVGAWNPKVKQSMAVMQGKVATVAHEMAHSFGMSYEGYSQEIPMESEPVFDGFDASGRYGIIKQNASIIGSFEMYQAPRANPVWIDKLTYGIIFNTLSKPIIDPKTIRYTAILSKDGKVSDVRIYSRENGVESVSEEVGDIEVRLVDGANIILDSKKVQSDFRVFGKSLTAGESGVVNINYMPVILEFSENSKVAGVQIIKNGKIISSNSLTGARLLSAIEYVPLKAFNAIGCRNSSLKLKFADKEKQSLIKIASEAQIEIDRGNYSKAGILLKILKAEVKILISVKYIPTDVSEFSRSSLLGVIANVEKSIARSKSCGRGK